MTFEDPVVARIARFLERVGIPVIVEPLADDTLLPGATVRHGALLFDPASLPWPGDLLHEAGHIAVTDPAQREALAEVSQDVGEEMAAMAWSYAAAVEIGIDPAIVFHEGGYQGGGANFLSSYTGGSGIGVPMLQYYGMTAEPRHAATLGRAPFPAMTHWLRQPGTSQPE
ncbi:hypothetical protein [Sphingomonas sp. G-3-2-10]|uniref:hypothetical protein n=1 Tax=Sphingomonas sp. G-3-2-10 TaxID=2728838 RepID=UPI00146DABB0|nr:hypothetical protein [Sphingomonas sp. G-3-2-10]NML05920.1 hypothetical protein [Sphingomonas sp. G-3-2-10]